MITESQIYWITRFDSFLGFFIAMLFLNAALHILLVIIGLDKIDDSTRSYCDDKMKTRKRGMKTLKKSIIPATIAILFGLGIVFMPSTKEMCAIKIIPIVTKNQDVQELPSKIVDVANEWIEELRPKKEAGE